MDFALSTEQQDLADAERAWLVKNDPISERRSTIDAGPAIVPATARKHVVESGLAGLLTSDAGGTDVDLLVLAQAHGWAGSALPLAEMAIAASLLEQIGDPGAQEAAAGDPIVIPVLAGAGESIAEITRDGLRISGTTAPATGLIDAERVVIIAQTANGRDVAVVVPADRVGIRVLDTLDVLRSWAVADVDLTLEYGAWSALEPGTVARTRDQLSTYRAVDALGAAQHLLELSVDYAGQRTQFGAPIGSFQAIKHHLANMATTVEASRSVLWAAALALGEDDALARARAVSAAVAYACRGASNVAQLALQVHGGIGFTWEHDVHLLLRRIKVDELLDGSVADHRRRLVDLSVSV